MSRYLTPRTVFIIIKFWTVGATVLTLGVLLPLGIFRVAQFIANQRSELASCYSLYYQLGKLCGSTLC